MDLRFDSNGHRTSRLGTKQLHMCNHFTLIWAGEYVRSLEEKLKRSEEERMNLEFKLADVIDENEIKIETMFKAMRLDQEIKMNAMRLKFKKIRKYAISQEAWYHYVVGSVITLVAILIAFVVGFKFFS